MNILDKTRLLQTSMLASLMMGFTSLAYAQDTQVEQIPAQQIEDEDEDEVVITGSRLKKDTFNSIVPLQVIDTDIANESGLFNPVEILQSSSATGGQQIDSTFQGFVLDNGPGSEQVDLRGLGADRTLIAINSIRVAPSGVEGAPSTPSINLLPSTMIDRYDILTDGASSVYGSDAVAGVINVILKNDFDGLEANAFVSMPEQSGGEEYTLGASYGKTGDRGYIGGALEYRQRQNITTGDRDFLSGCDTYREIDENGDIRTVNVAAADTATQLGLNQDTSPCIPSRLTSRIIAGGFGSIYYQPGINNTGIAGFSESTLFGVPIDGDADGDVDVEFFNFSPNGQQGELQDIVNDQEQISFMAAGEYTFEGDMNITPFFQVLYSQVEVAATSGQPQLFPFVSANNPFNPCNLNQPNGTDCGAAYNAVLSNPAYLANFENYYTNPELSGTDNCFGLADFGPGVCNPFNFGLAQPTGASLTTRPVIGVRGDRNSTQVKIPQTRLVGGVKGDLPFINSGDIKDWSFEVTAAHSFSDSTSSRSGIRGDRLNFALGNDIDSGAPVGNTPCVAAPGQNVTFDVSNGCVPVNLFAPSLYTVAAGGDFATQAERDYLFDSRDFDTHVAQTIIDGIVQGDIFTLPGGDVSLLLGAQYREDIIDSRPDNIARDGLFFGFFNDGGAQGSRDTKEVYGEISIPLGLGKPGFREFNVDLAGRLTDDEFYGTNETYSIKAGWRPVDSLLLRGTYGTSFRAPNLRELFLAGQSGFGNVSDPCAVPDAAYNALTMTYDPTQDTRNSDTLANCVAAGVDPTSFLAGQFQTYSVEIEGGGAKDLNPETSDSMTLGFSFEQPFTDAFDFELGVTYYDIDIRNTIIEPSAAFIVGDCYVNRPNFSSAFCSRISRDFNDVNNPGVIDLIDSGFINRNQETAKGFDISSELRKSDIAAFDRTFDFGMSLRANRNKERKVVDIVDGVRDEEEFRGQFNFSEWRGFTSAFIDMDKWRVRYNLDFIGAVSIDDEDATVYDLATESLVPTNYVDSGDVVTCGGPARGDVNCRPVGNAKAYFTHDASLIYRADDWSVVMGVNNIFDKAPPLVDPFEVFSVSNVPIGGGYDIWGREFFLQVRKSF